MALYKFAPSGVLRTSDRAFIPADDGNADWVEYQKWLSLGNSPDAPDLPPAPVDQADLDNLEKSLKALGLVVAQWTGHTIPELRAAFRQARDTLAP